MAIELPVGFAMALAMNEAAIKKFEALSPAEKESVIQQAHSVKSRQEMRQLIAHMAPGDDPHGMPLT